MFSLSIGVFCLASHGVISTPDTYFLFFPGPLIFFLLGHFICKSQWKFLGVALFLLMLNQSHLLYTDLSATGYNREIYLSLYSGVFLLLTLRNMKPRLIDNWLGAISYGCFLAHMLLQVIFTYYWKGNSVIMYNFWLIFLSICCGSLSYLLIEMPTIRYRRLIRNRNSLEAIEEKSALSPVRI